MLTTGNIVLIKNILWLSYNSLVNFYFFGKFCKQFVDWRHRVPENCYNTLEEFWHTRCESSLRKTESDNFPLKLFPRTFSNRWRFRIINNCVLQIFKISRLHLRPSQLWISPTFYTRIFCTKVSTAAVWYLHFRFVLFWRKNIGTKAALKMLTILTQGFNFTLVKCAAFLYKSFTPLSLGSFFFDARK